MDPTPERSESEESFYSVQSSLSLEDQSDLSPPDLTIMESANAMSAPFRLSSSPNVAQTSTIECNVNKSDDENGGCGPTFPPFFKSTRIQHGCVMKIATMYEDLSPLKDKHRFEVKYLPNSTVESAMLNKRIMKMSKGGW